MNLYEYIIDMAMKDDSEFQTEDCSGKIRKERILNELLDALFIFSYVGRINKDGELLDVECEKLDSRGADEIVDIIEDAYNYDKPISLREMIIDCATNKDNLGKMNEEERERFLMMLTQNFSVFSMANRATLDGFVTKDDGEIFDLSENFEEVDKTGYEIWSNLFDNECD